MSGARSRPASTSLSSSPPCRGKTNELVGWCKEAAPLYDPKEYDVVVASGEQVTSGLLAIVLQQDGLPARSWQGWQIPIRTSDAHGSARIEEIDGAGILAAFEARREVAVVSGFQGVHAETGRITTLGRGGSDTSAVALAAALKADRCDIYTDVDGVYTTDPRVVPRAKRLDRVSFEEMLEMASQGAKVLQVRSVELAMLYRVPTYVRSSFDDPADPKPGTLICDEEDIVEHSVVTGIAFSKDEAQITLRRVVDKPGVAAAIFGPLADQERQCRHDHPGCVGRFHHDRHHLHGPERRLRALARDPRGEPQEGRHPLHRGRDRLREDFGHRRRYAQSCRGRCPGIPRTRREGHQHPRNHDLRDQVLDPDRRGLHRTCRADAALAIRSGQVVKRRFEERLGIRFADSAPPPASHRLGRTR
jgi:hypothetical protein